MENRHEQFMKELLAEFITEAAEHIRNFVNGTLELEKGLPPPDAQKVTETIFREIHSTKGAARAVSQPEIERLCQSLESALASLKAGRIGVSEHLIETFHQTGKMLEEMLAAVNTGTRTFKGEEVLNMIRSLTDIAEGKTGQNVISKSAVSPSGKTPEPSLTVPAEPLANVAVSAEPAVKTEMLRISREKINSLMFQSEEMISVKSMLKYFSRDIALLYSTFGSIRRQTDLRLKELIYDPQPNPLLADQFLKWHNGVTRDVNEKLAYLRRQFQQYEYSTSRLIDALLLDVRKTLLVPFSGMMEIFPRMVRDIAKSQGKEVTIRIEGASTEIDRRILEEMKDPLIHLIRNAVDHGIENPEKRLTMGKSRVGNVDITIGQTKNREVMIEIKDNGQGIDPARVVSSSVRLGLIDAVSAESMTREEILQLIFQSGVSTSPIITDLSGRGLGLAIVAEKIGRLGGRIQVSSQPGQGSHFIITLPTTLATFRGILIRLGEHLVMIPIINVEKVVRIPWSAILKSENQETMEYSGHQIPLFNMGDALGFFSGKKKQPGRFALVAVLGSGRKPVGFFVDEVMGEMEGILKPFGGQLIKVRNISEATLLGDGRMVPVIDTYELTERVLSRDYTPHSMVQKTPSGEPDRPRHILVAEDSLTSRSLLRNILETGGYEVTTAVDGWDAFTLLKQGNFDLLVSDIEMPRMNGFELCSKVRGEPGLSSLPVILITSLESAEDRKNGLEAGANAYIGKSSFEGSNLVSTIKMLI